MMLPFTVNALSATTVNTIQGNKPILSFDGGGSEAASLDYLLSFEMPDGSGGTTEVTPTTTVVNADPNDTFSSFNTVVTAKGEAITLLPSYYYDKDGDTPHATAPVVGTLKASWSYVAPDGTTKTLSASDLSQKFNACYSPYTLKIEASGIKVQSAYGDPRDNTYGSQSQSYKVNVKDYKICYAKPVDLTVQTASSCTGGKCKYAEGYNTAVFEPGGGFLPSASTKFPTVGFNGALFTLKMSNLQSDYSYNLSTSHSSIVSINNAGVVRFVSTTRPSLPITGTITATPNDGSFPPLTYSFSVGEWARYAGETSYEANGNVTSTNGNFWAASLCKDGTYTSVKTASEAATFFFSRTEVSNAPLVSGGQSSRDIDGGLITEWGNIWNYGYTGSGLTMYRFWTSEFYSDPYPNPPSQPPFQQYAMGSRGEAGGIVGGSSARSDVMCRN